jgi:hypothetical protein
MFSLRYYSELESESESRFARINSLWSYFYYLKSDDQPNAVSYHYEITGCSWKYPSPIAFLPYFDSPHGLTLTLVPFPEETNRSQEFLSGISRPVQPQTARSLCCAREDWELSNATRTDRFYRNHLRTHNVAYVHEWKCKPFPDF